MLTKDDLKAIRAIVREEMQSEEGCEDCADECECGKSCDCGANCECEDCGE